MCYEHLLTSFMRNVFGVSLLLSATTVWANTPAEMAELSLQELFNMQIESQPHGSEQASSSAWSVGLSYHQTRFEGYQEGTRELSNSEVLFTGVPGTRTDRNFPVLPTTIRQEALLMTLSYAIDRHSNIDIGVPYIKQSTDHISSIPNYETFILTSEGLGDTSLSYSRTLKSWRHSVLNGMIGVSVPTGSIDEKGDTPRGPGEQQLPYIMQLGSGTWDIPFGLNYQRQQAMWAWGTQLHGKIRLGRNDRDYRLGNRFVLSPWMKLRQHKWIQPTARLSFQYWEEIQGQDDELAVPGPFPYSANINNPNNFGGKKLNASIGISVGGPHSPLAGHKIDIEFGKPLYQNLNGIQNKEDLNFSVSWSKNL